MRRVLMMIAAIVLGFYFVFPRVTLKPLTPSAQVPTFEQATGIHVSANAAEDIYRAQAERQRANCSFPPLPDGEQVLLIAAYGGRGISSAALGDQDAVTTTASVTVEDGAEPLYVVIAASQPVIWRFDGAVDRVRQLAFASGGLVSHGLDMRNATLHNGVTGLPRDRVSFMRQPCISYFPNAGSPNAQWARETIRQSLGRTPEKIIAGEDMPSFAIPSGATTTGGVRNSLERIADQGASLLVMAGWRPDFLLKHQLQGKFYRNHPEGVIAIDPDSVVANAAVMPYDMLPGLAGLQSLVENGSVQAMGWDTYHIKRPIRMPAGLRNDSFLLLSGVPTPEGDLSQTCVVSEDTRQAVGGGC